MSINFYLNNDPKGQQIEQAIYCYIREQKRTICLNTGERINPKHWDKNSQKAKRACPSGQELNDFLNRYKENITLLIRTAKADDPFITFDNLKTFIIKEVKHESRYEFFEVLNQFIETRCLTVTKATTMKFKALSNHIRACCENNKLSISLDTIDLTFFDKLHNYFLQIGHSNNTIFKNMQFLCSFLRWAYEREFTRNNRFEKYQNVKQTPVDTIALTKAELKLIIDCDCLNESQKKVRDVFLFQLYTGQRFSDIIKFKASDVKNDVWYLRQQKTKKVLEIPIIEPAAAILEKYNNLLPVISNQKTNEYLKEIGFLAGLNEIVKVTTYHGADMIEKEYAKYELLTTHTARRSFVSLASYDNVNQQVVKSFTGHGTDKMLAKYFKANNMEGKKAIEDIFCN